MKKAVTTLSLLLALGFVGYNIASAGSGWGPGNGGCGGYGPRYNSQTTTDNTDQAEHEAFFEETKDIRKNIAVKRAEINALYANEAADPAQIQDLRSELVDLQDELRKIATDKGVAIGGPWNCPGPYGYRTNEG